jgi:hypothetical protein
MGALSINMVASLLWISPRQAWNEISFLNDRYENAIYPEVASFSVTISTDCFSCIISSVHPNNLNIRKSRPLSLGAARVGDRLGGPAARAQWGQIAGLLP